MANEYERLVEKIEAMRSELVSKMDELRGELTTHRVEEAGKWENVRASASAGHRRIDEHLDDHKAGKANIAALWIGVVLAVLSGALSWIFGRNRS